MLNTMLDKLGAEIACRGRTWFVFHGNRVALERVLAELLAELAATNHKDVREHAELTR